MGDRPTKEQLGRLRWLAIVAVSALFVVDYGFALFAKAVPAAVYYMLLAVAVGVDIRQARELMILFLKSWLGVTTNKDNKGP